MQKTLYKSRYSTFQITWHPNVFLLGIVNDDEEFVFCLFQIAFVYSKPRKKPKKF